MSKKKYRSGGYSRRGRVSNPRTNTVLNTKWKKYSSKFNQGKEKLEKWKDLNTIHDRLLETFNPVINILKLIKDHKSLRYFLTKDELRYLSSLVKMLVRDFRAYKIELEEIRSPYKNKGSNRVISRTDFVEIVFDVLARYGIIYQAITATNEITYDNIVDLIGVAEARENLAKKEEENNSSKDSDTDDTYKDNSEEKRNG